jgi:Glyoxalase-like domain
MKRLSPRAIDGATSRTLLVVDDPDAVVRRAVTAGATETSAMSNERGWRLGRIIDPFGHQWEIGTPVGPWPELGFGRRSFAHEGLQIGRPRKAERADRESTSYAANGWYPTT